MCVRFWLNCVLPKRLHLLLLMAEHLQAMIQPKLTSEFAHAGWACRVQAWAVERCRSHFAGVNARVFWPTIHFWNSAFSVA